MDQGLRQILALRANGRCECGICGRALPPGEVDHQWGRANQDEKEWNLWFLRPECHLKKSLRQPSKRYWLERILTWAKRHEYALAIARAEKEIAWVDAKAAVGKVGS